MYEVVHSVRHPLVASGPGLMRIRPSAPSFGVQIHITWAVPPYIAIARAAVSSIYSTVYQRQKIQGLGGNEVQST